MGMKERFNNFFGLGEDDYYEEYEEEAYEATEQKEKRSVQQQDVEKLSLDSQRNKIRWLQ